MSNRGSIRRLVSAAMIVASVGLTTVWAPAMATSSAPGSAAPEIAWSSTPIDTVRIDDGRRFTGSRSVVVGVGDASGGRVIDRVRLSNALETGELVAPETFDSTDDIDWQLAAGDDGVRTVYAQTRDTDGAWSAVLSDTIILDTTAPTGEIVINDGDATAGSPWGTNLGFEDPRLRMEVRDASFAAGGRVARMEVRNVIGDWRQLVTDPPPTVSGDLLTYNTSYNIHQDYEDDPQGEVTLETRWRDEAGNWSGPARDSIDVIQYLPVGRVWVDGTPVTIETYPIPINTTDISVRVHIDHVPIAPSGAVGQVDELWLSATTSGPWKKLDWSGGESMTVPWSLIDDRYGYNGNDGFQRVMVKLVPSIGRDRVLGGRMLLDRVTPTSDEPVTAVEIDSVVGTGGSSSAGSQTAAAATSPSVVGTVAWKGRDGGSGDKAGIKSYRLQRSVDDGSWKEQQLATAKSTKATQDLSTSRDYRFRVRASDKAGNVGSWKTGDPLAPRIVQDRSSSIRYSGNWTRRSRGDALGGTLRTTTTIGGSASLRFTGVGIAVVAPRSRNGDTFEVWIDGKKVKTANLGASSYRPRRVVFSTAWTKPGTHTIKLVHKYQGHELPLDAFVVLR